MECLNYNTAYEEGKNVSTENMNEIGWSTQQEIMEPPIVLEPDHPLMQKFQAAYKECLLKENEKIRIEILELKEDLKKRKIEYEKQMSVEMYNFEQEVANQRNIIVECKEMLDNSLKTRKEKEESLSNKKNLYKTQMEKFNEEEKKALQLRGELEALTVLQKQYEMWKNETNSELAVNQRRSEKLNVEKRQLAEEKKKLDAMIYKLTIEVWNLESQIKLTDDQMKIKSEEFENIKNRAAESAVDLETLQAEQKYLLQLWNSVIISIQKKDKIYAKANADIEQIQTEIKTTVAKMEGCKKEINQAMKSNEELTATKQKLVHDLAENDKAIENEELKKTNLEIKMAEISTALEITEKDFDTAKAVNTKLTSKLNNINKQHEKLKAEKVILENETLDKLEEKLSYDKNAQVIALKTKQLKECTRKEEIIMTENKNKEAKWNHKIENQKLKNLDASSLVEENKKNYLQKEAEVEELKNEQKEILLNIDRKENTLVLANKKLDKLIEKNQGKEISPYERKIEELQIKIDEESKKIKDTQQEWLRMQGQCIQSSKDYQKLLSEINTTREQIQLLENKMAKLENKLNEQRQDVNSIKKSINNLQIQIDQHSKRLFTDKEHNKELEANFKTLALEYTAKLKDCEMEVLIIQEEMANLEEEKVQMVTQLRKCEREVISWQRMVIMAVETKHKVDEEKSATGEIGRMKTEIHRMQIRQSQVSATAARLASDLAQTVFRRAAAVEKVRSCPQSLTTHHHTIQIKIKLKKSEIRKLNQEIEANEVALKNGVKDKEVLQRDIDEKRAVLIDAENEVNELQREIQEGLLLKQKNLERIIRYQRYAQHCASLLSGRHRIYTLKSEPTINAEYEKQKKLNSQLTMLVHSLLPELLEHRFILLRILNTLDIEDVE